LDSGDRRLSALTGRLGEGTSLTMTTATKVSLQLGDPAPDFSLVGDDEKTHRLADYRGRRVVLYFYPKDDTPGCTQEACDFRDRLPALGTAVVLGVSPDTVASHKRFKQKYSLPFTLLADPGAELAQRYGAWGEKNLYGKKSVGLIRSTFVIDEHGNLSAVYGKVSVKGHVENVVAVVAA
jgi:peroxiredoxin Q/BCP